MTRGFAAFVLFLAITAAECVAAPRPPKHAPPAAAKSTIPVSTYYVTLTPESNAGGAAWHDVIHVWQDGFASKYASARAYRITRSGRKTRAGGSLFWAAAHHDAAGSVSWDCQVDQTPVGPSISGTLTFWLKQGRQSRYRVVGNPDRQARTLRELQAVESYQSFVVRMRSTDPASAVDVWDVWYFWDGGLVSRHLAAGGYPFFPGRIEDRYRASEWSTTPTEPGGGAPSCGFTIHATPVGPNFSGRLRFRGSDGAWENHEVQQAWWSILFTPEHAVSYAVTKALNRRDVARALSTRLRKSRRDVGTIIRSRLPEGEILVLPAAPPIASPRRATVWLHPVSDHNRLVSFTVVHEGGEWRIDAL